MKSNRRAEPAASRDALPGAPGDRAAVMRIVVGAVMISFSGVYVKLADVVPAVSAFYRVFFGGLFLLAACAARRRRLWNGWGYLALGTACGVFFALDLILYHAGVLRVGPGLGTILPNFQVFLMALAGVLFFRETLRPGFLLALPLAMAGLFLIVGVRWEALDGGYRAGVLMGLGAAFCYAGFLLTLRRLQTFPEPLSVVANLTLVSFLTAGLLAMEVVRQGAGFAIPDTRSWMALLAYGLFSQMLGWILITRSLPRVRPSLAGLLLLLQPALAFVWDVLFFQRPTSAVNLAGVALALAGIYLGMTAGGPVAARRTDQPASGPPPAGGDPPPEGAGERR